MIHQHNNEIEIFLCEKTEIIIKFAVIVNGSSADSRLNWFRLFKAANSNWVFTGFVYEPNYPQTIVNICNHYDFISNGKYKDE